MHVSIKIISLLSNHTLVQSKDKDLGEKKLQIHSSPKAVLLIII